eukprot:UN24933
MTSHQKKMEELRSLNKALLSKEKNINRNLEESLQESKKFQTEKQKQINKISIYTLLRLSQFQCLIKSATGDYQLPDDLEGCVIFPKNSLDKLYQRPGELAKEEKTLKREHINLKKNYKVLQHKFK